MSGCLVHNGSKPPPYPHVVPSADGFEVVDAKGERVTTCATLGTALAWTRLIYFGARDGAEAHMIGGS